MSRKIYYIKVFEKGNIISLGPNIINIINPSFNNLDISNKFCIFVNVSLCVLMTFVFV
jgi:hypothetical protein